MKTSFLLLVPMFLCLGLDAYPDQLSWTEKAQADQALELLLGEKTIYFQDYMNTGDGSRIILICPMSIDRVGFVRVVESPEPNYQLFVNDTFIDLAYAMVFHNQEYVAIGQLLGMPAHYSGPFSPASTKSIYDSVFKKTLVSMSKQGSMRISVEDDILAFVAADATLKIKYAFDRQAGKITFGNADNMEVFSISVEQVRVSFYQTANDTEVSKSRLVSSWLEQYFEERVYDSKRLPIYKFVMK